MKIKDCLACKLKGEDVSDFIVSVSLEAYRMESVKDAWEAYWDDCEDDDSAYPRDFLEHMGKDHSDELDDIVDATFDIMRDAEVKVVNRVKEVF